MACVRVPLSLPRPAQADVSGEGPGCVDRKFCSSRAVLGRAAGLLGRRGGRHREPEVGIRLALLGGGLLVHLLAPLLRLGLRWLCHGGLWSGVALALLLHAPPLVRRHTRGGKRVGRGGRRVGHRRLWLGGSRSRRGLDGVADAIAAEALGEVLDHHWRLPVGDSFEAADHEALAHVVERHEGAGAVRLRLSNLGRARLLANDEHVSAARDRARDLASEGLDHRLDASLAELEARTAPHLGEDPGEHHRLARERVGGPVTAGHRHDEALLAGRVGDQS
mmetsp:Transcript_27387/g.87131  ORF Transcript_27387/g.87131 Transcript_27387/m.87131 type:complete len:278 (+) Transcript_27387:226-1059(+)